MHADGSGRSRSVAGVTAALLIAASSRSAPRAADGATRAARRRELAGVAAPPLAA